jgi:hypothetical protein
MLATSSLDVRIVQNVGKPKELRVLATIFSSIHPNKSLQTTAVVDCGAAATCRWKDLREPHHALLSSCNQD